MGFIGAMPTWDGPLDLGLPSADEVQPSVSVYAGAKDSLPFASSAPRLRAANAEGVNASQEQAALSAAPAALFSVDSLPESSSGEQELVPDTPVVHVWVHTPAFSLGAGVSYLLRPSQVGKVSVGSVVSVPLSGRNVVGWVRAISFPTRLERPLRRVNRVLSPHSYVSEAQFELAWQVARRYAGSPSEVLAEALGGRHARAQKKFFAHYDEGELLFALGEKLPTALLPTAEETEQISSPPGKKALEEALRGGFTSEQAETERKNETPPFTAGPKTAGGEEKSSADRQVAASDCSALREQRELFAARYPGGGEFLARLAQGEPLRCAWLAAPEPGMLAPYTQLLLLVRAVLARGSLGGGPKPSSYPPRVLVVFAQTRQAEEFCRYYASSPLRVEGVQPLLWGAQLADEDRETAYLRCRYGLEQLVVGARSAIFAPLPASTLTIVWDEASPLLGEQKRPHWHARQVAVLRSRLERSSLVLAGYARSAFTQGLVQSGWMESLALSPVARLALPRLRAGQGETRLARHLFDDAARREIRAGLKTGPVLIAAAFSGRNADLLCTHCMSGRECGNCRSPLQARSVVPGIENNSPLAPWMPLRPRSLATPEPWAYAPGWELYCTSCSAASPPACKHCGQRGVFVGTHAEPYLAHSLARSFPGVPLVVSSPSSPLCEVKRENKLVLAGAGAFPQVEGGYARVFVLDSLAVLRHELVSSRLESLRRWWTVAGLAAPHGQVFLLGSVPADLASSFSRRAAEDFAREELETRAALGFAPCAASALLQGEALAREKFVAELSAGAESWLHVSAWGEEATLVRCVLARGEELRARLSDVQRRWNARKAGRVRVSVDPEAL